MDLPISDGVPQDSVLGPLLLLLYLLLYLLLHTAIKFYKVHHFADDINLVHISNCIKKLSKCVNFD